MTSRSRPAVHPRGGRSSQASAAPPPVDILEGLDNSFALAEDGSVVPMGIAIIEDIELSAKEADAILRHLGIGEAGVRWGRRESFLADLITPHFIEALTRRDLALARRIAAEYTAKTAGAEAARARMTVDDETLDAARRLIVAAAGLEYGGGMRRQKVRIWADPQKDRNAFGVLNHLESCKTLLDSHRDAWEASLENKGRWTSEETGDPAGHRTATSEDELRHLARNALDGGLESGPGQGPRVIDRTVTVDTSPEVLAHFCERARTLSGFRGIVPAMGSQNGPSGRRLPSGQFGLFAQARLTAVVDDVPTELVVRTELPPTAAKSAAGLHKKLVEFVEGNSMSHLLGDPDAAVLAAGSAGLEESIRYEDDPDDGTINPAGLSAMSLDEFLGPDRCIHPSPRWVPREHDRALHCDDCYRIVAVVPIHQLPEGDHQLAQVHRENYMAVRRAYGALFDDPELQDEAAQGLTFDGLRRRDGALMLTRDEGGIRLVPVPVGREARGVASLLRERAR